MASGFGELKRSDVRLCWKNEQTSFTPWLAKPENMARLCKAVGMELEVENTEVAVGPYSADILAKDTTTDRYVVIENQFGRTNHDHLGKLLTYAATLDASAVIWIAEDFTEEHQRALEWLNDHTSEDLSLYGVALEVWQIDDSKPAPRFAVVSRPPGPERRAAIVKAAGELTDARKLQLEFWTAVSHELVSRRILVKTQTPRPSLYFDVTLGNSGVYLSNVVNTLDGRIAVRVCVRKSHEAAFAVLERQRAAIEEEIGEKLVWNLNPGSREKVIALSRQVDLENRQAWPDYCNWMATMIGKFIGAFGARVKGFRPSGETAGG